MTDLKNINNLPLEAVREDILQMPAQQALDALISHPKAKELVRSFSAQDLYFLIHEIGLDDCLPILSLASTRQWQYLMDVDIWQDDRLDFAALTTWMDRMLAADPERLVKWMAVHETEMLEWWLYNSVSVAFLEHDQEVNDLEDGYFTLDGSIYVKVKDTLLDNKELPDIRELADGLLRQLGALDWNFYYKLMFELHGIIPAETEEESFRIRNIRLAERGFSPPHEAASIYRKLDPAQLLARPSKVLSPDPLAGYAKPLLSNQMAQGQSRFSLALEAVDNAAAAAQIHVEFASLCNQVIAADRAQVKTREDLGKAVKKCSDYLNMGLDALKQESGQAPETSIRRHTLTEIFQVGLGKVLDLSFAARKWRKASWFESQGLALSFWGEKRLGVLGGLLLEKPLYFDDYQSGVLYREFESLQDAALSRQALDHIMALDALFSRLDGLAPCLGRKGLTCESLLLTPWARSVLGLVPDCSPLDGRQLREFFNRLLTPKKRQVRQSMKESCVDWLAQHSGQTVEELSTQTGQALEDIFHTLEGEYGGVAPKDLDPRHVRMILCMA